MQHTLKTRLLAMLLAVVMVLGVPMTAFANEAGTEATEGAQTVLAEASKSIYDSPDIVYTPKSSNDYYKLISQENWELAPGIMEAEIVLNNEAGIHRQVAHVVEVDINNPYTKVIPSSKGMVPTPGKYGVEIMSKQAAYAEANGYGNVVAAMNIALSWYDSAYYDEHPELIGEPLGYLVLDGVMYTNSQGQSSGAQTCLVINFDEKDGVARPADIPKTQIRSTKDAITGWEEQVIPANLGFLVKDGKNQYGVDNNPANGASRSFMGIKADGSIIIVMNDGRQAPFSTGFTNYEMAEFMLSLGCVYAVNGDGGGSSAILTQRPGETLNVNCAPSDGAERATTHGILVISTAPSTGEFVRAKVAAPSDFFTPDSSVQFTAVGSDLVGAPAEIPAEAIWQLADPSMGTIENGLFVSNGTTGTVTAQLVYKGEVVGEDSINVVVPDALVFSQPNMVVPYNKTVALDIVAKYGYNEVVLKDGDIQFTLSDDTMGVVTGSQFATTADETVTGGTVTATLSYDTSVVAVANVTFGKASEIVYDFETGASSIENITIAYKSGYPASTGGWSDEISVVTAADGKVKNGNYAMKIASNSNSTLTFSWQQTKYQGWNIDLTDAVSLSFWMYIPEGSHGGEWDIGSAIPVQLGHEFVYGTGWQYFTVPVSDIGSNVTSLNEIRLYISDNSNGGTNYNSAEHPNYHADIVYYIDDITVNYSSAVDDNHAPIISNVLLTHDATDTGLEITGQTITENTVAITASIADDTSYGTASGLNASSVAVYVDGVLVESSCNSNGFVTTGNFTLANGTHMFRIEASDKNGNTTYVEKTVVIAKEDSNINTIKYAPVDPDATYLLADSLYWMELTATAIEQVQKLNMVIDLDLNSDWELDNMILAAGFDATYTIDAESNDATIVITRTGKPAATGEAVIAQLPIRVWKPSYANVENRTHRLVAVESFIEKGLLVETNENEVAFGSPKYSTVTEFNDIRTNGSKPGLYHEHDAVAVTDKAATCTENGYTGRTYCAGCDSIADWGTVIVSDGHDITHEDGLNVCGDCGVAYYYIDGVAQTGWINVDGKDYYCDESGLAVDGEATVDGHTYLFVDYVLTDGAWEHDGVGLTCWWAGELISGNSYDTHWKTINGKKYYFNNIYVNIGVAKVQTSTSGGTWYNLFDENGVFMEDFVGIYDDYYFVNGVMQSYTLFMLDGDYYFVNDGNKIAKNVKLYLSEKFVSGVILSDGNPFPAGLYIFGADGKITNPPAVIDTSLNGIIGDYYYINGVQQTKYQLFEYEGNYYFINDGDKIAKNTKLYLSEKFVTGVTLPDGSAFPAGLYHFGADGKITNLPN